jgi:hypothetical protein
LPGGIVTGILRIGKENLFSGLNNLELATVLDAPYSRHFGFTETEVAGLLAATGLAVRTLTSSPPTAKVATGVSISRSFPRMLHRKIPRAVSASFWNSSSRRT